MSEPNKNTSSLEKLHRLTNSWYILSSVLELILAFLVTVAIVISIVKLIPDLSALLTASHTAAVFTEYLEEIFTIVIGIEFLKMLCHPNSDNILETLIFLVARHMIINSTTPLEDLVSSFTVVMLLLLRHYLKDDRSHKKLSLKDHKKQDTDKDLLS